MRKIVVLAAAAFLFTGVSFAQDGKKCTKGKDCCSKDMKKSDKKDAKTAKASVKVAAKPAAKA